VSDPLQSLTGDAAGAALLRRSLTELAAREAGTPLGYRIREVLAGERDVRSLADDQAFADLTRRGMAAFSAEWEAMDPEERQRQLQAGEEYLAALDDPGSVEG
jgi:hypothetical protein